MKKKPFTSAVILAAGSGLRFGQDQPKQFTEIDGIPAIVYTISAFERCDLIQEIILVTRKDETERYRSFVESYGFKKVTAIVEGGSKRSESALSGFEAISDKSKFVAIHDGARCLVTEEMIANVAEAAYIHGAAAAGKKTTDTVKYENEGFIESTIDRNHVWMIQTPQIFMTNMYRACAYMAQKDGVDVTDDCMMAERLGFRIKLVDCGSENIKLTHPEDIFTVQNILKKREGEKQ